MFEGQPPRRATHIGNPTPLSVVARARAFLHQQLKSPRPRETLRRTPCTRPDKRAEHGGLQNPDSITGLRVRFAM